MLGSNRCKQKREVRRGATLVEFAITLPIVFLLLFGMIELSRLFMLQHSADTAAYEGARNAIVPGAKPEEAVLAASELLRAAGVRSGQIFVEPNVITEETALVKVTAIVPLSDNGWVVPNFFGGRMVKSEVTLICERPPMIMLTGIPHLRSISNTLINQSNNSGTAGPPSNTGPTNANANANVNANVRGNGNGNGNGNANANANANANVRGNGNGNANVRGNGNGNGTSNVSGNSGGSGNALMSLLRFLFG